mgnify:FL=1
MNLKGTNKISFNSADEQPYRLSIVHIIPFSSKPCNLNNSDRIKLNYYTSKPVSLHLHFLSNNFPQQLISVLYETPKVSRVFQENMFLKLLHSSSPLISNKNLPRRKKSVSYLMSNFDFSTINAIYLPYLSQRKSLSKLFTATINCSQTPNNLTTQRPNSQDESPNLTIT